MCLRLHIEVSAMRILKTSSYTLRSNTEVIVQFAFTDQCQKMTAMRHGNAGSPKVSFLFKGLRH